MAAVTLTDVNVLVRAKLQSDARRQRNLFEWAPCTQDNPAPFNHPLKFEISYQCFSSLKHDLEWAVTYVGSAEDERFDQQLDSVSVGPVHPGSYKFVFQVDPPDESKIPEQDILGVTVILLTCSYNGKARVMARIGYYVNNEYTDPELKENPPERPQLHKLCRNILADKPRVTRFEHHFDNEASPSIPVIGEAGESKTHNEEAPPPDSGMAFYSHPKEDIIAMKERGFQ